jgi:hypothetical protein
MPEINVSRGARESPPDEPDYACAQPYSILLVERSLALRPNQSSLKHNGAQLIDESRPIAGQSVPHLTEGLRDRTSFAPRQGRTYSGRMGPRWSEPRYARGKLPGQSNQLLTSHPLLYDNAPMLQTFLPISPLRTEIFVVALFLPLPLHSYSVQLRSPFGRTLPIGAVACAPQPLHAFKFEPINVMDNRLANFAR